MPCKFARDLINAFHFSQTTTLQSGYNREEEMEAAVWLKEKLWLLKEWKSSDILAKWPTLFGKTPKVSSTTFSCK